METITPQLNAPLPAGWFFKESITVLEPSGQANVIVSSEPLDPAVDTATYTQLQGELLVREFPRYHEVNFRPVRWLGGRRAFLRHFTWTPPDGVPVTQIQAYWAGEGRGFTATATSPSTTFLHLEDILRDVVMGVVLADPPGRRRSLRGGWSSRGSGRRS